MWAELNWLIKDSTALIACIVAKGTKGGMKEEKEMPVREIQAHQPQSGKLFPRRVAWTKLPDSYEEPEDQIPC